MKCKKFKDFDLHWFEEPDYDSQGKIAISHAEKEYKVWYGIVGKDEKKPLLILHGGPGGSHSNLVPLQALGFEREVIFYDQLGCGYSDKPDNTSLWHLDRYVEEVNQLVKQLGLKKFHLLGHSWGGMLATAFVHKHPNGVLSLSLMSPILNMRQYVSKTSKQLKKNLPEDYSKIIDKFERGDNIPEDKYQRAVMEHLRLHICKFFPNPPELLTRFQYLSYDQVHDTMVGKRCNSELNVLGNLKDVDVSEFISGIEVPILFTCGDVECCPPGDVQKYYKGAKKGKFHVFENCRHMTMLEETVQFLNVVHQFISELD